MGVQRDSDTAECLSSSGWGTHISVNTVPAVVFINVKIFFDSYMFCAFSFLSRHQFFSFFLCVFIHSKPFCLCKFLLISLMHFSPIFTLLVHLIKVTSDLMFYVIVV
jgi:hypothetical protein